MSVTFYWNNLQVSSFKTQSFSLTKKIASYYSNIQCLSPSELKLRKADSEWNGKEGFGDLCSQIALRSRNYLASNSARHNSSICSNTASDVVYHFAHLSTKENLIVSVLRLHAIAMISSRKIGKPISTYRRYRSWGFLYSINLRSYNG